MKKEFCCYICKKTFVGGKGSKYCSIECRNISRRAIRAMAWKKRDTEKICVSCGRSFQTHNVCKVYCTDECRVDYYQANIRVKKQRREIPKANCCICGVEYDLFYIKTVTCRNKACIRAHALDMKHKRIANGTPITKDRQQIKDLTRSYQIIDSICPGCGVVHKYRFEPAWIGNGVPRKKCAKYPSCMTQDISGLLSVRRQYQDTFETENRATI